MLFQYKVPTDIMSVLFREMVWRQLDVKLLPEHMITHFCDPYMRHQDSMC